MTSQGRQDYTAWFTEYPNTHVRGGETVEVVPRALLDQGRVSPNRQGWRARLANVERLLTELDAELVIREQRDIGEPPEYLGERVLEALAEVRSMIDGIQPEEDS